MYRNNYQSSPSCTFVDAARSTTVQRPVAHESVQDIWFYGMFELFGKKNDNLTIGEGRLLSAPRGCLPFRCFGFALFSCMAGSTQLFLCWEMLQWPF